ncbi:hypothetical protein SDC9_172820 [bioreactor metagenome]|uniref:Uncharacterized protein n=1 Tax=bioreactor metagenome TaxID=1076179 RepID=A0A645GER8_9ZZZZ
MRLVVALHGPVARDGDLIPAGIVEFFGGECLFHFLRAVEVTELPLAVEVLDLRTVERLEGRLFRLPFRFERKQGRAAAHPVDAGRHGFFPEPDRLAIEQFHDIFSSGC